MTAHFAGWDDDALALAVDRVTIGLDPEQSSRLHAEVDPADLEEFELVTAALHLGALDRLEAPPPALLERLRQDARRLLPDSPAMRAAPTEAPTVVPVGPAPGPAPAPSYRLMTYTGWLAAAAVLVVALVTRGPNDSALEPSLETLVASGVPDLMRIEWSPTDDPLGAQAEGEVVWSAQRQEGYMVFRGLAPNDPREAQYQLWVFDTTRADWEAKPVDGGVFDVAPDGTTVVPIDPKLEVRSAGLFAVTLEVPGGVVVSEREHLVLTAAP